MKRSGDIRWGELRLGLLIFVALALFLWASIQGGANLFQKRYHLHSKFSNVQGVVRGAPIWFQGVEVGAVKGLDFVGEGDSSYVLVTFHVNGEVWPRLHRDSRVRIQALNVFGEKFMEVTPGSPQAPAVADGDTLQSELPVDLTAVMAKGQDIVDDLKGMTSELKVTMHRINQGQGTLGKLATTDDIYVALKGTSERLQTLVGNLDESQGAMRSSLVSLAASMDSVAKRMERGDGTLGRLSKDPQLYDNLARMSGRMDSTLARVERGEGNLGRLSRDEAMYQNLEQSLDKLNKILGDIQAHPDKYFKISIF
jgi:phospholipid/cholesterol/gamma-HCH transport system substrate-binding protein